MEQKFYDMIESNPVIAAVKDTSGVEKCCQLEDIKVVFILFGDICSIADIVKKIKDAGKIAIVHIDLVAGLSSKEISVSFIKTHTQADGIITTKPGLIKKARELSLLTVLRYFLIDSMALENIYQQHSIHPDFIEVLPGLMPQIINKITRTIKTPVVAGGLIADKESVVAALKAGAISVSTTNQDVWIM